MTRAPLKGSGVFLAVFLFTAPLFATIFLRLRASAADSLKATGGRIVYDAKATVNGRDATITVIGFDRPLPETASAIRSAWGLQPPEPLLPRPDGAWITRTKAGRRQTLLLLPGTSAGTCSAWLVESPPEEAGTTAPPPGGNPLPATTLTSWIENGSSGTLLTVHETTASPGTCLAEGSRELQADGWTPMVEGASCSVFARGDKVGAMAAFPAERTGITRAVVLRQR